MWPRTWIGVFSFRKRGSIKVVEFLDDLSDSEVLKKVSAPCTWSISFVFQKYSHVRSQVVSLMSENNKM